jgi:hypothetical protein
VLPELAGLPDRVHDLAEQVLVGQALDVPPREALAVLGLELLDLQRGDLLELGAHPLARLQLLAVDQDRERSGLPAPVLDVVEQGQLTRDQDRRAVGQGPLPPRDVVEDELRDVTIVADDDEHGRRLVAGPVRLAPFPEAIAGLIVAVEAVESPLKLDRELGLARNSIGLPTLAGQLLADAGPEVAIGRLIAQHRVIGDGDPGNLDDARLDGVNQREVGDDPGEERPFAVARAAEEERGRRQVVNRPDAGLVADRLQAREPDAGLLIPLLGLGAVLALERLGLAVGLAAVAVVGLVVDDHDVPLAPQLPADPVDHLGRSLVEVGAQDLLGQLVRLDQLAGPEGMEIGDQDLGPAELPEQVGRNEVAQPVVVLGVVGPEHPQPVADRDPGGDHEERVGEPAVLRVGDLVQGVPGDQHGHDDRLARSGRHLHRDAVEPRVGRVVGVAEPVLDPGVADLPSGLAQVDERFQGLDLAEEELVLPVGVGPVLQELPRDLGNPLVFPFPPVLDPFPDAVDLVIRLDAVLRPFRVKLELLALLPGCGDRDEVRTRAPGLHDLVGDPLVAEPEVPGRFAVGRVQDRVLDQGIRHAALLRLHRRACIMAHRSARVNEVGQVATREVPQVGRWLCRPRD